MKYRTAYMNIDERHGDYYEATVESYLEDNPLGKFNQTSDEIQEWVSEEYADQFVHLSDGWRVIAELKVVECSSKRMLAIRDDDATLFSETCWNNNRWCQIGAMYLHDGYVVSAGQTMMPEDWSISFDTFAELCEYVNAEGWDLRHFRDTQWINS